MSNEGGYLQVCPRCGQHGRNKEECTFCGCTMVNTQYTIEDMFASGDPVKFKKKILNEYFYGNPLYSDTEYRRRLEKEEGYSSSALRCPNCGSTAVTTGQKGYSVLFGFAGSSRTVNRCGKCGYSWEP